MDEAQIGIYSVALIVLLIYSGLYVPVALGLVSFLGVWILKGNLEVPINLLSISVAHSIADHIFAVVPLFAMMGLVASRAGLGADIYQIANQIFRKVQGGLGIATVAANTVFAAITGSSIASASVFTRVTVPEMRRYGYRARFTVGVIAGSSVLGMLIPPSVMLILYAIVAEQSVGKMFIAGVVPGLILAAAYGVSILVMARRFQRFVGKTQRPSDDAGNLMSLWEITLKFLPIFFLVILVLGGIYGGVFTPEEAGAAGSLAALIIAVIKRRLSWRDLWEVLVETGYITASILFLLITASMYSRMLGIAGLPTMFSEWMTSLNLGYAAIMAIYVILLLFLGTIVDTASIILVVVPLFMQVLEPYGISLVWFGIVTVVGAEIGLLTPPFGISCFTIKSAINDPSISLNDIFAGAFPFAVIMLLVLILIIVFPVLSLVLI